MNKVNIKYYMQNSIIIHRTRSSLELSVLFSIDLHGYTGVGIRTLHRAHHTFFPVVQRFLRWFKGQKLILNIQYGWEYFYMWTWTIDNALKFFTSLCGTHYLIELDL